MAYPQRPKLQRPEKEHRLEKNGTDIMQLAPRDGSVVGVSVGARVGTSVGDCDGIMDGTNVQFTPIHVIFAVADGSIDGSSVGVGDGPLLGANDVVTEGSLVGGSVGESEGSLVGSTVGLSLGVAVVGVTDGTCVGRSLPT